MDKQAKDWRAEVKKTLKDAGVHNSPGSMRVVCSLDDRLGAVLLVSRYYSSTKPNDPYRWVCKLQAVLAKAGVDKRVAVHPSSAWVPWYNDRDSRDVAVVMDQPAT